MVIQKLKKAFTLSEILMCLTIIGVVAAMTVPVLHKDTSEKQFDAGKKKAHAMAIDAWEYGVAQNDIKKDANSGNYTVTADNMSAFLQYFKLVGPGNTDVNGNLWSTEENKIIVDINGDKRPNEYGKDKMKFCPDTINSNGNTLYDCTTAAAAGS